MTRPTFKEREQQAAAFHADLVVFGQAAVDRETLLYMIAYAPGTDSAAAKDTKEET